jgi:hypothetical protein
VWRACECEDARAAENTRASSKILVADDCRTHGNLADSAETGALAGSDARVIQEA